MILAVGALASWFMLFVHRKEKRASIPFEVLSGEEQLWQCRTKVVMSGLSKVKVSSFVGVDLDGGVDQFEP